MSGLADRACTPTPTIYRETARFGACTVTGACNVGGALGVTGNATVGGTLGVTGNATVGGTLSVANAATFSGTVSISNDANIGNSAADTCIITANTYFNNGVYLNPGAAFSCAGSFGVGGAATFNGAEEHNAAEVHKGTCSFQGATYFYGPALISNGYECSNSEVIAATTNLSRGPTSANALIFSSLSTNIDLTMTSPSGYTKARKFIKNNDPTSTLTVLDYESGLNTILVLAPRQSGWIVAASDGSRWY